MFSSIYLLAAALCIWGGCLIARLIANRLELGLFRRKQRRSLATGDVVPGLPPSKRRSNWWTLVALMAIFLGAAAAFLAHGASNLSGPMFDRGWLDSLAFALLIASLGLSAGLVLVGFRFDPHLGRRRCPKCWYDLCATKGLLCPECGHEAASERRLYRTRRSRLTIAIALVPLFLAPVTMCVLNAYKVGWVGLIPTTALVLGWDVLPDSVIGQAQTTAGGWSAPTPGTLTYRIDKKDLWPWQVSLLDWRTRSTCMTSTDPKAIVRALQFQDESTSNAAFIASLATRLPPLMPLLSDPDPGTRTAVNTLVYIYTFDTPNWNKDSNNPIYKGLLAAKPSLIAHVVGANLQTSIEALQLLRQPGLIETLDAADLAPIEAFLTDPNSSSQQSSLIVHLLGSSSSDPLLTDMFLRVIDLQDGVNRAQLSAAILSRNTSPRMIERAIQTILSGDPDLAAQVANAASRSDSPRVADLREAVLTRFSTDQFTNPKFWNQVESLSYFKPLSDHERELLRLGLIRALNSADAPAVQRALTFISSSPDRSPELAVALDAFIHSLDPASPQASAAQAVRDKIFPPEGK